MDQSKPILKIYRNAAHTQQAEPVHGTSKEFFGSIGDIEYNMSAAAVSGGGSPQRETAVPERPSINGDGENVSSDSTPTSSEAGKAVPAVNTGVSSGGAEPHPTAVTTHVRPGPAATGSIGAAGSAGGPGGNVPTSRSHPSNQPLMNRGGIVSMSKISSGGGSTHNANQGGWSQSTYNNRPPQSMNRYNNDMSAAAGYGSYQQNRPYQQGGGETLSKTNLYIRGLTPSTTDHDLLTMCQSYGKIKSTKAIVDQATNKCKGYGFVDFEKPSDAERAAQLLQQQNVQAQMAKVRECSTQDQDPTNLYIANLPDYVDENYLESMVRPFGNIVSVRILRDNSGKSRNVGFCRMDCKEICERIIHEFNKKALPGSHDPLLVKFADSGNRRKREFRNQQAMMGYEATMQHGPMGGQMMTQSMNARYSMQPATNQSSYLSNAAAAGNWPGMPIYPQVAMSPVNPVTSIQSNIMDPTTTLLASQLSQMQLAPAAPNYGMQQNQHTYPQMYQNQGMVPQQFQYEMSASPPNNHLGHLEDHNYQTFGQM